MRIGAFMASVDCPQVKIHSLTPISRHDKCSSKHLWLLNVLMNASTLSFMCPANVEERIE